MNILLTGARGFIGHHLYHRLKNKHIILGVDDCSGLANEERKVDLCIKDSFERIEVSDVDVWYEDCAEAYARPPAPQNYFNCVIIMGAYRRECLEASFEYVNTDLPYLVLAVDDADSPYCFDFEGKFYMGGPVWRGE